ncbi:hypothetical protein HETIRDRAFT_457448 [Heterobasidion irregulare TC 32-1]|uniref:Uncharacterized protein n=1 Tax=Heterobasidion irregulare (strain TC 32-1) TaxID=747525 RepID=W4KIY0_HETIT|nr:uncharacterized protein HETIRDRAFT_457448 [Heterobasidion irregulare TC 32-1]ETW85679.1 hypothetical protein HETIRDRAFT_457448 [Heterobasidion irregulare TC 32-1]
MMDVYDAQMLDYSDIDVQMYTTVSSPKPWPHIEAIMEDDVNPHPLAITATPYPHQEDVEIDMEPEYTDAVEYEMADDGDFSVPGGGELVDVDLYDASLIPEADITDASVVPLYDLSSMLPLESSMGEQIVSSSESADSLAPAPAEPIIGHPDISLPQTEVTTVLQPDPPKTDLSHIILHTEESGEAVLPEKQTEIQPPVLESEAIQLPSSESAQQNGVDEHLVLHQPGDDILENGHISLDDQHVVTSSSELPESEAEPSTHLSEHLAAPPSHIEDHDAQATLQTDPETDSYAEAAIGDELTDDVDPHEISEGVYIDPPPPVLLELPSSSGQLECCLFNAPAASHQSPRPGSPQEDQQRFAILLQQRPTLYYERLSDVFAALREEERIQRIHEFTDGEMVLDAYDIRLVISEDNIYAREVTLHDLNVLHDGSDLSGPLRLRLLSVVPRFIDRYRSLKDQIDRLNLADDSDHVYDPIPEHEYYEPSPNDDHPHEEGYSELSEDDEQEGDQESDNDAHDDQGDAEAHSLEHDIPAEAEQQAQDEGDIPYQSSEQSGFHEVVVEEAGALEQEGDDESLAAATSAEITTVDDELDSSVIHRTADTDVPVSGDLQRTEYVEYSEPHEDDEATGEAPLTEPTDEEAVLPEFEGHLAEYIDAPLETSPEEFPVSSVDVIGDELAEPHTDLASNAAEVLIDDYQHDGSYSDNEAEDDGDDFEEHLEDDQTDETASGTGARSVESNHSATVGQHTDVRTYADHETDFIANLVDDIGQSGGLDEDWQEDALELQVWDETFDDGGDDDELQTDGEPDTLSTDASTLSSKMSSKRGFDEVDPEAAVEPTSERDSSPKRARIQ